MLRIAALTVCICLTGCAHTEQPIDWVPGYDPHVRNTPLPCRPNCGGESQQIMSTLWQIWPGQYIY